MKRSSVIFLVVLLGLVALFTVQNPDIVTVRFFSFEWNTSKLVLIVASFAAGLLSGLLVSFTEYFRKRIRAAEAKRTNQANYANKEPEADNIIQGMKIEMANLKKEIARLKLKVNAPHELPNPEEVG